jgi:hypothetical protein
MFVPLVQASKGLAELRGIGLGVFQTLGAANMCSPVVAGPPVHQKTRIPEHIETVAKQRGPPVAKTTGAARPTRISQMCFVARGVGVGGMGFLVEPRCMVRVTFLHECLLTTFTVERGADSHVYNVGSLSMYRLLEYKTMGFDVSPLNRPSSTRFSNMRRLVRSSCTQAISVHIQRLGRGFL